MMTSCSPKQPGRISFLSLKERKLIVNSWQLISDQRVQIGQTVYIQIFMHKPSLKGLFPFRQTPVGQLANDSAFTKQAGIFMDFVNSIVTYVAEGNEPAILQLSQLVGEHHAQMTTVKFEPDWWDLFTSSVLDSIRPYLMGLGKESTVIGAWKTLFDHVVRLMKEAFYQRMRSLSVPIGANGPYTPSPGSIRANLVVAGGKEPSNLNRKFGSLPATPILGQSGNRASRNLLYSPNMTRIQRLETLEDWTEESSKSQGDKKSFWSALKNGKC